MTTYFTSDYVGTLIRNAYEFERTAILTDCDSSNPYFAEIRALANGQAIWEGINEALEMHFHRA